MSTRTVELSPPPSTTDGVRAEETRNEKIVPPREHNTIVRVSLFILAVLATGGAVAFLGRLLEPLAFAVLLYFLLVPAVDWLERLSVPRWVSYSVLLLVVIGVVCGVSAALAANVGSLRERLDEYEARAVELGNRIDSRFGAAVKQGFGSVGADLPDRAAWTLFGFTEFGLMMFFYLVFIIFNARRLPGRIRRAFPERADSVLAVGDKISEQMQRFVGIKTVVSLGMGLTVAVILGVARLDYWFLWAFLFFLLNYITYLGSIVACVPPIALAFLQFDPVSAALTTAALVAARLVWIDVVEIKLAGQELNIDPVLLLLGLAFWGYFWGVAGLVLAVPIITSAKVILQSIEGTRPWSILMSEK